jgi:plasmid stabilization system protein ParE
MSARIRVMPEAIEQAEQADTWWRENRPDAPYLFREELDEALGLLASAPLAGEPQPRRRVPGARRVPLQRTRYHLYYVYEASSNQVRVLAVWSALRGRGPHLRLV